MAIEQIPIHFDDDIPEEERIEIKKQLQELADCITKIHEAEKQPCSMAETFIRILKVAKAAKGAKDD